jgi:HD-like signal output (HDOD) protein
LRDRIAGIGKLAAMPQVIWQIMGAMRDDSTTPSDLERIIRSDVALAAKILSLANSSFYGVRQRITTVDRAIVIIGFQELELMILGAGLVDFFDLNTVPEGFDGRGLWLHCLAVSWAARELAEAAFHLDPSGIMVAGLMHDLGKLILAAHLPDELARILFLVEQGQPYYEAEEQLGLTHADIGHLLAHNWRLPEMHLSVIRDHHRLKPGDGFADATALVALADHLVKEACYGLVHESRPLDMDQALAMARLPRRNYNGVAATAGERVPKLLEAWSGLLG